MFFGTLLRRSASIRPIIGPPRPFVIFLLLLRFLATHSPSCLIYRFSPHRRPVASTHHQHVPLGIYLSWFANSVGGIASKGSYLGPTRQSRSFYRPNPAPSTELEPRREGFANAQDRDGTGRSVPWGCMQDILQLVWTKTATLVVQGIKGASWH